MDERDNVKFGSEWSKLNRGRTQTTRNGDWNLTTRKKLSRAAVLSNQSRLIQQASKIVSLKSFHEFEEGSVSVNNSKGESFCTSRCYGTSCDTDGTDDICDAGSKSKVVTEDRPVNSKRTEFTSVDLVNLNVDRDDL